MKLRSWLKDCLKVKEMNKKHCGPDTTVQIKNYHSMPQCQFYT